MYADGKGVPQDDMEAYAWINIANAQLWYDGMSEEQKELLTKRMTPADISAAQKLSRQYWQNHVLPFQD